MGTEKPECLTELATKTFWPRRKPISVLDRPIPLHRDLSLLSLCGSLCTELDFCLHKWSTWCSVVMCMKKKNHWLQVGHPCGLLAKSGDIYSEDLFPPPRRAKDFLSLSSGPWSWHKTCAFCLLYYSLVFSLLDKNLEVEVKNWLFNFYLIVSSLV